MAFSNEELSKRLRNMAELHTMTGDAVNAKWLYEASARLMELAGLITSWHPSLTNATAATPFEQSYKEIVDWIVKNPFEGEL